MNNALNSKYSYFSYDYWESSAQVYFALKYLHLQETFFNRDLP